MAQLYAYTDYALQSLASDLWSGYYETIKDANAVLVRLPDLRSRLSSVEQLQLDYLAGEAKTLKALSYLQLLQLFATPYDDAEHMAGIVLKDRVEREELPRSTKAETVQAIERLLKEALTLSTRRRARPTVLHLASSMWLRRAHLLRSPLSLCWRLG